jgi:hypothetical protein
MLRLRTECFPYHPWRRIVAADRAKRGAHQFAFAIRRRSEDFAKNFCA